MSRRIEDLSKWSSPMRLTIFIASYLSVAFVFGREFKSIAEFENKKADEEVSLNI